MQSVKLVLAATEFELDGQEVQAKLPIVFLYLPAWQAVQKCSFVCADMSGPVYQTLHLHWSGASASSPFPAADTVKALLLATHRAQFWSLSVCVLAANQLFAVFDEQARHNQHPLI